MRSSRFLERRSDRAPPGMWASAMWASVDDRAIAISDAGALAPCLPQQSGSLSVYTGQDAKQTCLLIFFRDVGF